MNLGHYSRHVTDLVSTGRRKDLLIAGLLIALLMALYGWHSNKEVTRLVPPNMDRPVWIGETDASANYLEYWALYIATLVGNVTPGNVEFVAGALKDLMAPDVYHRLQQDIGAQIADIRKNSLTVKFTPNRMGYDGKRNIHYVTGSAELRGLNPSDTKSFMRTYEIRLGVRYGAIVIHAFDHYAGAYQSDRGTGVLSPGQSS